MKSVRRARANIFDLQPLEVRRFLTTASIVSGQLRVFGTSSGETITVNQFNSTSVSVTGVSGSFLRANFTTILVDAGGGNDTILISGNLGTPSTTILGGNGNDFITGGGGRDRISGDGGFDTANYSGRTSAIKVDIDGTADDGGNGGAEGDNVLVGTDEVIGGTGADSITGSSGADFLGGGSGGDTLTGGSGNDELVGTSGADRHLGQSGDDAIYAKNSDADTVNGGTNSDGTADFDLAEIDTGIDVSGLTASLKTQSLLAALQAANLESSDLLDPTYGGDEEDVGLIAGVNSGPDLNWDAITAAVVDSQGRTVLVGYDFREDSWDFVALRYDADGKWDQTFAGDGEAEIDFDGQGYGDDDFAFGVTVDADDNIIIVGTSAAETANGTGDQDFAICRLNENGTLDTVFGTRRYDIVSENPDIGGNGRDTAFDVVVQADDKIVVVGTSNRDIEFGGGDVAVIRLDETGNLDTGFNGGSGMNTLDVGSDEGVAVALQNFAGDAGAQRIVIGGSTDGDVLVARFGADGELDTTSFTPVGYVRDDLNELSFDVVNDIAVDANNDIVVVGQTTPSIITFAVSPVPGTFTDGFVGKVAANGSDSDYEFSGLPDSDSSYNAVAVDPTTNDYVLVGSTGTDFILARFTDDLVLHETFEGAPVLTDFTPGEDSEWYDVALGVGVLEDGKIIAAGYSDTCGDGCLQTSVARYGIGQEIEGFLDFDDVQNDRGTRRSAAATFYLKSTHHDDGGNAYVELTNNNDLLTLKLARDENGQLVLDEEGKVQVAMTFGDLVIYYDINRTKSIKIDGKNGNDVILVDNDVPIQMFIFGGNGTDQITGGGKGDVIVGGAGNDTVGGNDGNDILIGGAASDAQNGGNGEDILVGGTTKYDDNLGALRALSAEWTSGASNATRVDHLSIPNSGGLNGPFVLRVGSGATIFDDSAKDTYFGGPDNDWFFRRNSGGSGSRDVILDNPVGGKVTDF